MINELLWIALLLVTFVIQVLAYRYFGKSGLYAWMAIAIVLANIQVMKTVGWFGLVTALGNIVYGSTFLTTDIFCENHNKKDAKKAIYIGLFMLIATTIIMQVSLFFIPHATDTLSPALQKIFGVLPRITIASITAYLISQSFDVRFYGFLKKRTKKLWLKNTLSTSVSQFIDNVIFTAMAFIGVFEFNIILQIFITSYIMKFVVAILDTPFIYWARRINKTQKFPN